MGFKVVQNKSTMDGNQVAEWSVQMIDLHIAKF